MVETHTALTVTGQSKRSGVRKTKVLSLYLTFSTKISSWERLTAGLDGQSQYTVAPNISLPIYLSALVLHTGLPDADLLSNKPAQVLNHEPNNLTRHKSVTPIVSHLAQHARLKRLADPT